jgi:hypothetical protein
VKKWPRKYLTEPAINSYVRENFYGCSAGYFTVNRDVTDLDGTVLPENEMARSLGCCCLPRPSISLSEPKQKVIGKLTAISFAAVMPGAFHAS